MIAELLKRLGFSPSEIKVYLQLLRKGSNYPSRLSTETKLNRTNVYEALDRLTAKGVVSYISRNKVKWFEAKNPKCLLALIELKEEEIARTKKDLYVDIAEIELNIERPLEAKIFTGKKGLRMVFEDILEISKPVSLLGASMQFSRVFGGYFELWHRKRIERKIVQRTILPLSVKRTMQKRQLLEYKFIDDKYTSPTTTIVYGSYCVFIQWSESPICIKIESKEIAKSHQNYFDMLWFS